MEMGRPGFLVVDLSHGGVRILREFLKKVADKYDGVGMVLNSLVLRSTVQDLGKLGHMCQVSRSVN